MITTGTTLGGFVLGHKIGAGAMGTVYQAHQRSLGRDVVIKTLHPHLAEDENLITRFEREARHAAKLAHANTVQIIDFGFDRGIHYIAMELVEGIDLKLLLRGAGAPPIREGSLMILHLLRGLEAAHRHGVMHRDIKPANLMLTSAGSLKVMDFGLARQTSDGSTITMAGAVMGSAAYMSPEQAQGLSLDNRTDIFSAGLVAYEILCGVRAFPGDSYAIVMHNIIYDQPKPLGEMLTEVPKEVIELVTWMIEKDLDLRCPDISEARERLERVLDREDLATAESILRHYYRGLSELHPPPLPPVAVPPAESTEMATRVASTHPAETRTALAGAGSSAQDTVVAHSDESADAAAAEQETTASEAGHDSTTPSRRYLRWAPLAILPILVILGWWAFGGNSDPDQPDPNPDSSTVVVIPPADTTDSTEEFARVDSLGQETDEDPNDVADPNDAVPNGEDATGEDPNGEDPNDLDPNDAILNDVDARGDQRHTDEEKQVFRQKYRVSSRPWGAVYIDNDPKAYNEDGFFDIHLIEGLHLFRVVNEQGNIDVTLPYEVEPGDQNNSLVLDAIDGIVKATRR